MIIDEKTKKSIIDSYVNSIEGKKKLMGYSAMPIRRHLDYTSVARKIFIVDDIRPICPRCGGREEHEGYHESHLGECDNEMTRRIMND